MLRIKHGTTLVEKVEHFSCSADDKEKIKPLIRSIIQMMTYSYVIKYFLFALEYHEYL